MEWHRTADDGGQDPRADGPCPGCNDTGICGEQEFANYCSCTTGDYWRRKDAALLSLELERLVPKPKPAKASLPPKRRVKHVG